MELTPIINRIFKIFDPITFPIAISISPFLVAAILVINSGKLVEKATNVRLIIFSLMPIIFAKIVILSITISAPTFNAIIPITIEIIDKNVFFSSFFSFLDEFS